MVVCHECEKWKNRYEVMSYVAILLTLALVIIGFVLFWYAGAEGEPGNKIQPALKKL